jgi:probable rRNA maturation factor
MTMVTVAVDVQVACDDPGIPSGADIHSWVEAAVSASGHSFANDVEVAVRIVDAGEIQTLNSLYREKDKATNVLSFPAGNIEGLPDDASRLLGDIVVCASVVATEAGEQGKVLADHWGHMLVHGTLHLLGFDHENEVEATEMESLETRILASRSVTDPYEGS